MPNSPPTLGFILHDVARLLRKRFEQHAKGMGLTRSQWQALVFLAANQGVHLSGLAEMLEVEAITLTRIIDKLEAKALVRRCRHPTDRRMWLLYVTDEALPLIEELRRLGDATRAEALAGISERDRKQLTTMLTTMKENLLTACDQPRAVLENDLVR